jgi:ANTAR domain/GAF domain
VKSPDIVEASRRLTAALTPADLDETLAQITAAAVEVLPEVRYASISLMHADGRLETIAPTDTFLVQVDAAQYDLREGPCYEAVVNESHFISPDLAADPRWPRYSRVAVSAGIHAQAGLHLYNAKRCNAALNLFADQPGALADLDGLGELFSHQAAMALDYARHIGHLEEAARSRQLIGTAVGIVMERFDLDDARAFGFLARLSSTQNTKLRVVAERLIEADKDLSLQPLP